MKYLQYFLVLIALICTFLLSTSTATERDPCFCPRNLDPVCGTDGRTYDNPCMFKCESVSPRGRSLGLGIARTGRCDE